MSYEKVKSIKIDKKEGKVFINCASNNVRPLHYVREEYPYFSKILKEEGLKACETALFMSYESGSLQEGNNKYNKSLNKLRYIFGEEYKPYDWRMDNSSYGSEEYKAHHKRRESQEFKDFMYKVLSTPMPKQEFIITQDSNGKTYFGKRCRHTIRWKHNEREATRFNFEQEAQDYKGCFNTAITQNWVIKELKLQ